MVISGKWHGPWCWCCWELENAKRYGGKGQRHLAWQIAQGLAGFTQPHLDVSLSSCICL